METFHSVQEQNQKSKAKSGQFWQAYMFDTFDSIDPMANNSKHKILARFSLNRSRLLKELWITARTSDTIDV